MVVVVDINGLSRNMGHNIMDDYKGLVRMTLDSHEHFIAVLNGIFNASDLEKQYTWLRVMGLMETWDIITIL